MVEHEIIPNHDGYVLRSAVVAYLRWFVSASLLIAPTPPSFCQKTSSESPP